MAMGYHFQRGVPNWKDSVVKQPAGTPNKAVDSVQLLAEAKATNPKTKTILRHWYDPDQIFGGGYSENKDRARRFLASFVDGTFNQYAHLVDYLEGWNEYLANSQNAEEISDRTTWVDALTAVWNDEYRNQSRYQHIKLIVANAAVGNDIPLGIAKIAHSRDAVLGYHPYMPVRNGVPFTYNAAAKEMAGITRFSSQDQVASLLAAKPYPVNIPMTQVESASRVMATAMDDGRRYFWLRWQHMDALYQAHGVYPQWMFTEFNPLNYSAHSWGLHLDGGGGWRHPNVCNGNVDQYVSLIKLFLSEMFTWNKSHNNRALGGQLFTTNSNATPVWTSFETAQPEMNHISNAIQAYVIGSPGPSPTPTPVPTPTPDLPGWFEQAWDESIRRQTIKLNLGAALQARINKDGLTAVQNEWRETYDNVRWVFQAAENQKTGERRLYYVKVDDWSNIHWLTR